MGAIPVLFYDRFSKMDDVIGWGGQLGSFEAVFSPLDRDGRPRKLWDRSTGAIDPEVAKAWESYDIRLVLERNWPTLGPKLKGKLHVITGGLDTFYLEGAVELLKESLTKLGSDAIVDFAVRSSGFRYLVHGLSVGNITNAWTDDQRLALTFQPLPASGDVQVVFDAGINRMRNSPPAQVAEVRFNDQLLGTLAVSKREQLAITIPRELWNSAPVAVLELRFPTATYFRINLLPSNDMWGAWALWSIRFQALTVK